MGQLFADAARAYLSPGINDTDITISITAGGALFPVANGTDWFKAVLQDASGIEIVYVTAHTSGATSFTVTRGQEGTTARSFAAGSVFGIRVTSADMAAAVTPTAWNNITDKPTVIAAGADAAAARAAIGALGEGEGGGAAPGDIIMAVNPALYAAPAYLPADGSLYLRSSYPALSGLIPSAEWSTGTKLPNPGTLPPSTGSGVAFSPSGTYLAVAHGSSPYITIYKRSGDTFDKLSNPAALPAANAMACAWSDDETYLSVVTTADVRVYKRSGDVFTKLADPAASGVSNTAVTFSPGGDYLAVTGFGSPYLAIYKRSGDTFAKITNPATMPTGAAYGCVFSADGVYLAVSHNTSPFITIYKRSGDVFTKLTNPGVLPSSASSVAFSSNAQYLLVGGSGATPLALYKRSGDIFTRLADPRGATSVITAASVTFSKDNAWAAAVSASSGGSYLGLFARSGDVMTKITDLATSPTATCNSCDFSPDGLFLAVAHSGTPYVSIYKADPDIFATPRTTELVGPCYIKS